MDPADMEDVEEVEEEETGEDENSKGRSLLKGYSAHGLSLADLTCGQTCFYCKDFESL